MQKAANEPELIVVGHGNAVTALSLSGDGKILASGSYDGTVIVWDVETGVMRRLLRPDAWVSSLTLSPDGTTLVCDVGHVWDAPSGRLLRRSHRYSAPLACSPNGQMLACVGLTPGADSFSLLVTSLRTGRTLSRFPWGQDDPYAVAFSSDGQILAAASYDSQTEREDRYIASVIDLKTGDTRTFRHTERVHLFGVDSGSGVRLVGVSPDGSQLWNGETGGKLRRVTTPDSHSLPQDPQCVCLSPDGRLLAIGTDRGVVSVWSVATSERLWHEQAHLGWVREIAITRDGRTLATIGNDHTVRLWDAWSGTPGHTLGGRGTAVEAVAFIQDGQAITALSADGAARLWRIAPAACERRETLVSVQARHAPRKPDTARNLWHVPADTLPVGPDLPNHTTIASISPDGSLIALWRTDGRIAIWDRHQSLLYDPLPVPENHWLTTPVFSPDNRLFAAASEEPIGVQIFDILTGKVRTSLAFEKKSGLSVVELAFSPDSRLLAVGHFGFAATLWSVASGKRKRFWRLPADCVSALAFSPHADVLAIGTDYEETVWLQNLTRRGKNVRLIGHTDNIRSADFSPDGTRIATGSQDASVRLWNPKTGRLLATFLSLPEEAWVVYTPQGDYTGSPGVERFLLHKKGEDLYPILSSSPARSTIHPHK